MLSSVTSLITALLPILASAGSGCGTQPPLAPGTSHHHTIESQGISRDYIVFLPASYDLNTPTPLIVNYHGATDTDDYQETLTQLDDPFFNNDHIVIYPQGVNGTTGKPAWSGAPYSNPDVDDIVFTNDLLDHFEQTYCIDTTRIFAAGKSNGGGFVNYLACHSVSSRFAAFGPVAGVFYEGYGADGDSCQPSRSPQPILEIHGYQDHTAYYDGGSRNGGTLPPIYDWIKAWGSRNGCSDSDGNKTSQDNGLVDHFDFGCHTHAYAVQNCDHVWESTIGNADTERYSYGPSPINASTIVMNFFRNAPPLSL